MEINNYKHSADISSTPKTPNLSQSISKADFCDKNIHWYVGIYRCGMWIYNECVICKKRQEV